ncbi:MAG TPA: hypothetical protein VFB29_05855 [Pseudolabrys sp.]|nr:hypothetical protein [Pseudolabrys sp.]
MPTNRKFLIGSMLLLSFFMPARAQAPLVEKNVSMKMALMIIERRDRTMYKRWL